MAAVLALSGMLAIAGQIAPWLPSSMIPPAPARSNSRTRPIARGDPAFAGVAGSAGGWFFALWAWPGVAGLLGALVGCALLVALRLSKVPPPRHLQVP